MHDAKSLLVKELILQDIVVTQAASTTTLYPSSKYNTIMASDPEQESRRSWASSVERGFRGDHDRTQPSIEFDFSTPHKIQDHQSLWQLYRNFVRNHAMLLGILDDALNQIIFWTPHHRSHQQTDHDDHDDAYYYNRWREMLYGLLSLHRMATDLAATHQDEFPEDFGMTVELNPLPTTSTTTPTVSATSLRIAITVVHSLLPTILQLCRRDQQRNVRFVVEKIKFALRLVLMGSYWYQLKANQQLESCGLLMGGGMIIPNGPVGITVEQDKAWRSRQSYVGRRTGRLVAKAATPTAKATSVWLLLFGEFLHIYRPLHWAGIEERRTPSLRDWGTTLGIDVLSLVLLQRYHHSALNSQELRRRKFKLFLYLLRSPIFDKVTRPAASRTMKGVGKIPLVGSLMESYFWDWLLHWKHPFASELD